MLLEVALLLLLLGWLVARDRKPRGMPPGPLEIPFLGQIPVESTKQVEALRKQYGDIYTVRLGAKRSVMICDYATAKEVLARAEMSSRPGFGVHIKLDKNEPGGLLTSNGPQWVHDRRFVIRNLRNLGMGTTHLDTAIQYEANVLVESIRAYEGKPIKYPDGIKKAVLNIIWQMLTSKRFEINSPKMESMFHIFHDFRKLTMVVFLEWFFPILKFVPKIVKHYLFKTNIVDDYTNGMNKMIDEMLEKHETREDGEGAENLVDEYMAEMKSQPPGDPSAPNHKRITALYEIISELFGAGTDTGTNTLQWLVYYMALHPHFVNRARVQIDAVVPSGTLVSLHDKPQLPLVCAFLEETWRHSCFVVKNPDRCAERDTTILGYFIPKGTHVTVATCFFNKDPKHWDRPADFNPYRYIDNDGAFDHNSKLQMPFGSGRRQCPAEALARAELFLFAAALLRHFDVLLPPGGSFLQPDDQMGLRTTSEDQVFIYKYRE